MSYLCSTEDQGLADLSVRVLIDVVLKLGLL